jgi:hypothetical protein
MKVGNIVNGLAVTDVKRINKMNLIQFTKAVSEYIEQGYKLDVHSSRQVGLVLMVDLYKLESNVGYVGDNLKNEEVAAKSPELTAEAHSDVMLPVLEPNETTIEAIQESTEKLEAVETSDEVVNEQPEQGEETTPPVKKTRNKKTT